MNIANEVASRGSCPRLSVGGIITKDNRIIATGYNGAPPGCNTCFESGCIIENNHCKRAVHAEANAICHAVSELKNSTLYITAESCPNCLLLIIAKGVSRVVYRDEKNDRCNLALVNECGLIVERLI